MTAVREWSVGLISYVTEVLGTAQGLSVILLHDVDAPGSQLSCFFARFWSTN
jgi:hypothetical protein